MWSIFTVCFHNRYAILLVCKVAIMWGCLYRCKLPSDEDFDKELPKAILRYFQECRITNEDYHVQHN